MSIYCAIFLFVLSIAERIWPGWNGRFFASDPLTPAQARMISAIYLAGAAICLSLYRF